MTESSIPASVTVIGAGRMGAGIAYAFLARGSRVILRDVAEPAVQRGVRAIEKSLILAHSRGDVTFAHTDLMNRLEARVGCTDLRGADLVVEAVPEILQLKHDVWRQVASEVDDTTILATNTSSISISDLAAAVALPDRFLGMHFFNPVPVSKLVELIRGERTSDRTISQAHEWTLGLGKQPIVVADVPGFATSRLGVMVGLEAIRMLEAGVASAEDIDQGMVLGYGFPVGPLRLTDIVGLDVRLEIADYLATHLGPRFEAPPLLREKVAAGQVGRKSGQGFYTWPEDVST